MLPEAFKEIAKRSSVFNRLGTHFFIMRQFP
jgi:hypothetical protein